MTTTGRSLHRARRVERCVPRREDEVTPPKTAPSPRGRPTSPLARPPLGEAPRSGNTNVAVSPRPSAAAGRSQHRHRGARRRTRPAALRPPRADPPTAVRRSLPARGPAPPVICGEEGAAADVAPRRRTSCTTQPRRCRRLAAAGRAPIAGTPRRTRRRLRGVLLSRRRRSTRPLARGHDASDTIDVCPRTARGCPRDEDPGDPAADHAHLADRTLRPSRGVEVCSLLRREFGEDRSIADITPITKWPRRWSRARPNSRCRWGRTSATTFVFGHADESGPAGPAQATELRIQRLVADRVRYARSGPGLPGPVPRGGGLFRLAPACATSPAERALGSRRARRRPEERTAVRRWA